MNVDRSVPQAVEGRETLHHYWSLTQTVIDTKSWGDRMVLIEE